MKLIDIFILNTIQQTNLVGSNRQQAKKNGKNNAKNAFNNQQQEQQQQQQQQQQQKSQPSAAQTSTSDFKSKKISSLLRSSLYTTSPATANYAQENQSTMDHLSKASRPLAGLGGQFVTTNAATRFISNQDFISNVSSGGGGGTGAGGQSATVSSMADTVLYNNQLISIPLNEFSLAITNHSQNHQNHQQQQNGLVPTGNSFYGQNMSVATTASLLNTFKIKDQFTVARESTEAKTSINKINSLLGRDR